MKNYKIKKKKVKKGFTLIELLASVIILTLIFLIVIPLMLNSLNNAKEKQFNNSVSSLVSWLEKQYDLYEIKQSDVSIEFINFCQSSDEPLSSCRDNEGVKSGNNENETVALTSGDDNVIQFLKASGLNPEDFSYVKVNYNNSYNKICVNLTASDSGSFKEFAGQMKKSSGCL